MFMGLPTVLSFVALSTNATAPDEVQLRDCMAVTIEISGDVARDYVRLAKPERIAESFRSHGTLLIDGVVRSTSEDAVELQHKVIVAEIGEPVRRAIFEVTIDRDDIDPDALKIAAEKNAPATPQI